MYCIVHRCCCGWDESCDHKRCGDTTTTHTAMTTSLATQTASLRFGATKVYYDVGRY